MQVLQLTLININFLCIGIGGVKCDECAAGFVQAMPITPKHPVLDRKIPYGDTPM